MQSSAAKSDLWALLNQITHRANALLFLSKYQSTLQTTRLYFTDKVGHSLPCNGFVKKTTRCSVFCLTLAVCPHEMLNLLSECFRSISDTWSQVWNDYKIILLVHKIPGSSPRESSVIDYGFPAVCLVGYHLSVPPQPTQNQHEQCLLWCGGDYWIVQCLYLVCKCGPVHSAPLASARDNKVAARTGKGVSSPLSVILHAAKRSSSHRSRKRKIC